MGRDFLSSRLADRHTMPQQTNLFSPEPGDPSGHRDAVTTRRRGSADDGPSTWLRRTELLVRVVVRLYLGLLIIALPWLRFWTENGLLRYTQATAMVSDSGFVRGMVSGLGVLNVVIALRELFFPKS